MATKQPSTIGDLLKATLKINNTTLETVLPKPANKPHIVVGNSTIKPNVYTRVNKTNTDNPILEFQDDYRWLSNFAPCKIFYNGYFFNSTENAYQAAKCANVEDILLFVNIEPGHAKRLGRKIKVRSDWEAVKLNLMKEFNTQKFNIPKYEELLIDTDSRLLQEGNKWNDKFWGVCLKTGEGENNLGKIIMDIREELYDYLDIEYTSHR